MTQEYNLVNKNRRKYIRKERIINFNLGPKGHKYRVIKMENTNKVNNSQINGMKNRYTLGLLATLCLLTSSFGINAMMFSPISLTIPLTRLIKAGSSSLSAGFQSLAYNQLVNAIRSNNLKMFKLLLPLCTKETINKAYIIFGRTPLFWACWHNNLEMFKLLLPLCTKETINKVDTFGKTPLHEACCNNNLKMVKLLLPLCTKETINKVNNYGETPLYFSCYRNNLKMFKLLLPYCTKETINTAVYNGRTALYWACYRNNLEIVKLLLEWGADIDQMALNETQGSVRGQYVNAEIRAIETQILNAFSLTRRFDAYKKAGAFFNLTLEEQNDKNLSEFAGKLPKSVRAKLLNEEFIKSEPCKLSKVALDRGEKLYDTRIQFGE